MIEAMKCGAYPIITDIGALAEVAGPNNASVISIEGKATSKGFKVTDNFINKFTEASCEALNHYDQNQPYYHKVSKIISDYVTEKYNWKNIAEQWKLLISNLTQQTMTTENHSALTYTPIDAQQAVFDDDYLQQASANVLRWKKVISRWHREEQTSN